MATITDDNNSGNSGNNNGATEAELDAEKLVAAAAMAMASAIGEEDDDDEDDDDDEVGADEMLDPALMKKSADGEGDEEEDDVSQMDRIEEAEEADDHERRLKLKRIKVNDSKSQQIQDSNKTKSPQKIPNYNYLANLDNVVDVASLQAMNNVKSSGKESNESDKLDSNTLTDSLTGEIKSTIPASVLSHVEHENKESVEEGRVGKPLSTTRRAAQNRAAQKAFRERRKQKIEELEKVKIQYNDALQQLEILRAENLRLMKRLAE